jgi:hypothetical protein
MPIIMGLLILVLCAALAPAVEPEAPEPPVRNETTAAVQSPETTILNWPARPRLAALALIAKFGEPNRFDEDKLAWDGNAPWRETVVYRRAPEEVGGLNDDDDVKQSIFHGIPPMKIAELKRFDARLKFDPETGILSSYSPSEKLNFLALNLAAEIANNTRDADEAREFYRKTVELAASGKNSAYMNGFLFPLEDAPPAK